MKFPNRLKSPVNPKRSAAQKRLCQDPEHRAKLVKRLQDYKKLPAHQRAFRDGVPDGMRKPEARRRWAEAKRTAKRIHNQMVEDGTIDALPEDFEGAPAPGPRETVETKVREEVAKLTDEQMASAALREAMTTILSPYGDAKLKQQAINTVLTFTKARPAQKIDAKFSNAEAWLEQVAQDAKS